MILERLCGRLSKTEVFRSTQPTVIGVVPNQEEFSASFTGRYRISSAKIRFDSPTLGLSPELMQFFPTLDLIVTDALSRNNKFSSNPYNSAHMSVYQNVVQKSGNELEPHHDSGKSIYVVADIEPTLFYLQKYKLPREKYSEWATIIVNKSKEGSIWRAKPYNIVLFNGESTFHSSPPPSNAIRTFLRVDGFD